MEDFKKNVAKYLPYLEDLRRRLYRGAVVFVLVFLGSFLSSAVILKNILRFFQNDDVVIAASSPLQFTEVAMDIGFFVAIMVSVPYIIYSFYAFASPALTRSERMSIYKSIPICVGLFIVGFIYGFFILYYALGVLAALNASLGIANFWNVSQFLSQMLLTSVLLGMIFELPLLLTLLIKMGILSVQTLKNSRRVAYFIASSLAAILPPTDGVSLLAMALPLVLLYEGTILLNSRTRPIAASQIAQPDIAVDTRS